jgi:hypothetical protein
MQPALTQQQQQQQQGQVLVASTQLLLTAPQLLPVSLNLLLIQLARQLLLLLSQLAVQLTQQQSSLTNSSSNSSRLLQLSPAHQQHTRPALTRRMRLAVLMCLQLQQHWMSCRLMVKLQLKLLLGAVLGQMVSPVSPVGQVRTVGQASNYKQLQKGANQAGTGASHPSVLLCHWQRCCRQCPAMQMSR